MRMTVLAIMACLLGTAAGRAPDTLWVRRLDLGSYEYGKGVASRGNAIAVVGYAWASPNMNWLVVKLDQSGDMAWDRRIEGLNSYAGSVCFDAESNILVAGYSTRFQGDTWHSLVAKYDSLGQRQWLRDDAGYLSLSIAADTAGNCYLSGSHVLNDSEYDFWLAKLDSSGDTIWTRTFDFSPIDYGGPLALDRSGNIVACVDIGSTTFDCLTLKLSPEGYVVWTRRYDLGSDNFGSGLDLDPNGGIVVAGATTQNTDYDALVLKYDSGGTLLWSRVFDFSPDDELSGASCDSTGDIYVAGYCSTGGFDQCLTMKLDSSGDTLWTATYGGPYDDQASDVTCDADGNPIIAGMYTDSIAETNHLLVAKYSALTGVAESPRSHSAPLARRSTITAAPYFVLSVPSSGRYDIRLCDLTGRMRQPVYCGHLGQGVHRFSLAGQPAGPYLLRVAAAGSGVSCQKLVLVK